MKRLCVVLTIMALGVLIVAPIPASAGQPPLLSTTELVENSYKWDGKTVSFKGEVLQDLMVREDGTWMNLSDGNNTAMGVFVPEGVAMPALSHAEDYRTVGDVVLITGVFHRVCVQHEGETDIHAVSVTVLTPGSTKANPVHLDRVVWFVVLAGFLGLVMWLYYRKPTRGTEH
ncbi:hypothetical protein [Candidatus Cryosericum septentrionale]|jgi:hypothetical protein|uniref:DNA-binding protein n=1 Tax=Candidatus Cryosericum septentrionale TaxID=2290913 RepID=A0A398E119_9BACT|nr:hypothetical protein [Candidatus Cryosericum septentrionale]RIE17274.1 hypothetical protein SMC1_02225 [Candidatus Cryosericum septentrionale]